MSEGKFATISRTKILLGLKKTLCILPFLLLCLYIILYIIIIVIYKLSQSIGDDTIFLFKTFRMNTLL